MFSKASASVYNSTIKNVLIFPHSCNASVCLFILAILSFAVALDFGFDMHFPKD